MKLNDLHYVYLSSKQGLVFSCIVHFQVCSRLKQYCSQYQSVTCTFWPIVILLVHTKMLLYLLPFPPHISLLLLAWSTKPWEHCHMLCSLSTAFKKLQTTPVIFFIFSKFHCTVIIAVAMIKWKNQASQHSSW